MKWKSWRPEVIRKPLGEAGGWPGTSSFRLSSEKPAPGALQRGDEQQWNFVCGYNYIRPCLSLWFFWRKRVVSDLPGREGAGGLSEAKGLDRRPGRCPLPSRHPCPWGKGQSAGTRFAGSPCKLDSGLTISAGISPRSPGHHPWGWGAFPPKWGGKGSRNCPVAQGSTSLSPLW